MWTTPWENDICAKIALLIFLCLTLRKYEKVSISEVQYVLELHRFTQIPLEKFKNSDWSHSAYIKRGLGGLIGFIETSNRNQNPGCSLEVAC